MTNNVRDEDDGFESRPQRKRLSFQEGAPLMMTIRHGKILCADGQPVVDSSGDFCNDPEYIAEKKIQKQRCRMPLPLTARAVAALARREYSRKELQQKLARSLLETETPEELNAVMDRLEQKGLLSDQRFALGRARLRATRLGDARIRRELRESGIESELVNEAMASIEVPEAIRALRVWRRRYSEIPQDFKEREKQVRYLAYRGFSSGAISAVLRGEVFEEE